MNVGATFYIDIDKIVTFVFSIEKFNNFYKFCLIAWLPARSGTVYKRVQTAKDKVFVWTDF